MKCAKILDKLFLSGVIFVCCWMISCSSDTPDAVGDKAAEMSFNVPDLSRASLTTSLDRFAIYGDMRSTGADSNGLTTIFNRTEVVKTGDIWSYNGTQYWFTKHEYSFVAVYPLSVLESENNPKYETSKLSFSYSLPLSEDNLIKEKDVKDIVAATHHRLYNEGDVATPVILRFNHLMSLISFSLENVDKTDSNQQTFFLHNLGLSGLSTSASFTILPAELQSNSMTDDRMIEVSGQEGSGLMVMEYDDPINVTTGTGEVSLIMLPQTLAEDSEAVLTLTYSLEEDGDTAQASVPLKGLVWETGKIYNYRLQVNSDNPGELVFESATITDWKVADAGNFEME